MLKKLGYVACECIFVCMGICVYATEVPTYEWAIIGGGPSGIVTAFVLKEAEVADCDICWIDADKFSVGRLGKEYANVPSNNQAKVLREFLSMCKTFSLVQTPAVERLSRLDPEREYELKYIIDVLQDMTDYLLKRISTVPGFVDALEFVNDGWLIRVNNDIVIRAQRVVLAIGSHPRSLSYPCEYEISLDKALNKEVLAHYVNERDTVAVIGGAHSAVLVMKFLYELGVGRIINFYRNPLYYLPLPEEKLRACEVVGGPLAGMAAEFAREILDKNPPPNLMRIKNSPEALRAWLPLCNKIVYAVGFERNPMPTITGMTVDEHAQGGILGRHLFGIGIAFPELIQEDNERCRYAIGLQDFVRFAQRMVPVWMTRSSCDSWYRAYEDLFSCTVL